MSVALGQEWINRIDILFPVLICVVCVLDDEVETDPWAEFSFDSIHHLLNTEELLNEVFERNITALRYMRINQKAAQSLSGLVESS